MSEQEIRLFGDEALYLGVKARPLFPGGRRTGQKPPPAPSRLAPLHLTASAPLTRRPAGTGPRGAARRRSPAAAAGRGSRGCRAARRGAARAARGRGSSAPDAAAPGPSRRRRLSLARNRKRPGLTLQLRSNAHAPRRGGGTGRPQRPLGNGRTAAVALRERCRRARLQASRCLYLKSTAGIMETGR